MAASSQTALDTVRFGVVVFPGSNCDADSHYMVNTFHGASARYLWHKDTEISDVDCVFLPGGFSYGDYLRCGAIARFSPIMAAVRDFAADGGLVIGICNGFQILLEAGMLPGAIHQNEGLKFICRLVNLRVEDNRSFFTSAYQPRQVVKMPIAHHEGNYFIGEEGREALEANGQVLFRYCDADGEITPESNPNGSLGNVAGICNVEGNVFGMMPHPERVSDAIIGGTDGRDFFESIIYHVQKPSEG